MPQIKSLNGYEITDEYARTQVEQAMTQIEEVETQINELSTVNESIISQIEELQNKSTFDNITVGNDLEVVGEGIFNDIVNFRGNLYLDNLKYLSTRNADGAARNAIGMNSSNQLLLGYGGYSNSEGSTNLYGNRIYLLDKGDGNAICSLNGGSLLPEGADLNDYVTVGNYYSNNSTLSKTLVNTPYTGGSLSLKVICPYSTYISGVDVIIQEMTVSNGRQYWRRTGDAGTTWTNWYLNLSGKDVADYIVAQGTSGNWYYEKYASGRARCTGQFTYTNLAYSASSGSGYYNTSDYINFPFSFTDRPHVYGTIWAGSGLMSCSINHLDLNSVGFFIFCTLEYTNSPDLFVLAEGWWK